MGFEQQVALENEYVMHTFGREPVEFVSGSGMVLTDDTGKEYLDFLSGIGVVSLGHCHPAVVDAVTSQAKKLIHVSNYYYIEQRGELAKMLSDMLSTEDSQRVAWKSFFANSGAEANECAIKIARLHARKRFAAEGKDPACAPRLIVTLQKGFHGRTLATLAATAQPAKQEAFQPLPAGFLDTPINDIAALEALFAQHEGEICAVMLECIQGESGVHPCAAEFLQAARRITRENDALLICDEVQSGIFRTAKPFGFQNFGITPDVVTIAKGVASGLPAGACAARGGIADTFDPGDHGSTFGGSNIAIAAAHATLTELCQEGVAQRIAEVGAYLREKLAALPHVTDVRGYGLMVGMDLTDDAACTAPEAVAAGLEAGFVLNATGPRTMRFLPPLVCEKSHVDALVACLGKLL